MEPVRGAEPRGRGLCAHPQTERGLAQGAGSYRETGAPRSLAERQVRHTRRVRKAALQPGVEVRGLPASLENADRRWGAAHIPGWFSPEPSCRDPGAPRGSAELGLH